MTDARQLQIFVDCPFGGCEDGYCACLEQDIDEDFYAELDDEEIDPAELAEHFGYVPARTVRRYCNHCHQVVHVREAEGETYVPRHEHVNWSAEGLALEPCPGSRTHQLMEAAP
ncbi:hypothetical protein [Streptomyces sp. UG1]|uniref:hypothetical protein n=1 Tax=Streptomyces sp. UG1 TaxID=3417652 RepID=UPI003CF51580